jgi:hypothetical protein
MKREHEPMTAPRPGTATEPGRQRGRTYLAVAASNPCDGCEAPCCRVVVFPQKQPQTFLEIDYFRYILGFSTMEVLVDSSGEWSVIVHDTCRHFDTETHRCTVHGTPRQPRICSTYPPEPCWYKHGFTGADPPDMIRFDAPTFERVLEELMFDDEGWIVRAPDWDHMKSMTAGR